MKEIRQYNGDFSTQDRTVKGYGAVFESESQNIGWIEIIHRGAITEDTIKNSDVFAKFNHDDNKVLARSKNGEGSLKLSVDDNGLLYEFEAPKTTLGDELLEYLQRGDLTQSSFAFTVSKDKDSERWYKKGDTIYRDIYKIDKLFDVSPVFQPAYNSTTCSNRYSEVKAQSDEIDNKMNLIIKEIESL